MFEKEIPISQSGIEFTEKMEKNIFISDPDKIYFFPLNNCGKIFSGIKSGNIFYLIELNDALTGRTGNAARSKVEFKEMCNGNRINIKTGIHLKTVASTVIFVSSICFFIRDGFYLDENNLFSTIDYLIIILSPLILVIALIYFSYIQHNALINRIKGIN